MTTAAAAGPNPCTAAPRPCSSVLPLGHPGVRLALAFLALAVVAGPGRALAQRPLGIDVSDYQGTSVNWTSVKSSGRVFAWTKATEGASGQYVSQASFTINENNGKAAGVYMGAYHYAHPERNTPAAEASYFWGVAGGYIAADGLTLMPMLDIEGSAFNGNVGASSLSDWINQWCTDIVQDAANKGVSIKPFIYISAGNTCPLDSTVAQWNSDIANYGATDGYADPTTGTPWTTGCNWWGTWNFWQYASKAPDGSVSGVSGACDVDVFNGTLATLQSKMIATASSSSTIFSWDPQGTTGANPYTGSMSGTWENNAWAYGYGAGQASPVGWTDGKAACFGVHAGSGTPAYTVTMNSSHVVAGFFDGGLSGVNASDVTISGSGIINLASGPQALDAANGGDGSSAYLRIYCTIAGNGMLYPEGNGQSFLHGTNTYTGGTQLGYPGVPFSGTVNFNNGAAFGVGSIILSNAGTGGTLMLEGTAAVTVTNPVTVGSAVVNNIVGNAAGLTFSGNWSMGANLLTLGTGSAAGNQTIISGVMSGTAGLTVQGSGTLVLSGVNTYSGTTTINSPAVFTIGGSGQLGSGAYGSSIVNGGSFNYNSTANQTLSGVISGTGKLSAGGSGTLTLNAANTYTGTTTINSGATLKLGVANGINSASSVYLANGGTLDLNGKGDSIATLSSPVGGTLPAGNVINANGTLTLNGASALNSGDSGCSAYSGVISGSGSLVISGGGSHTLSGANTYGGTTTVSGGTLVPGYNGALPAASGLTVNSPGIFDLVSVNETIPSLAGSGTVNLGSGNLTVGGSASTTFSGVLQGSPSEVYVAGSTSQPGLWGYYYATNNPDFVGTPVMRLDSTVNFSDLTTQQPAGIHGTNFSVRWVGQLLTTSSAGTYTFTTTSDDGSRVWVNGQLVVNNWAYQGPIARSGTITLAANTYYDIRVEYEQGVGGGSCVVAWTPPGGSSVAIPSSNLSTYAGYGGLVKSGSSTLTLAGANTYKGVTTISGGTLSIGADNNLGAAPAPARPGQLVINGGTLAVTASIVLSPNRGIALGPTSGSGGGTIDVTSGKTLTYSGILADNGGTGALTKTDAGILLLNDANQANTYSGGTTVSGGTLNAQARGALGSGNATVANGAVLQLANVAAMGSAAALTLNASPSAGTVALNFSGTQSINALYFGSTQKAAGTWAASGASHNNPAFTGMGVLDVLTGPASSTGLSLTSGSTPSTYGSSLTFTATVTGNSPGGTVQFYVDGVAAGSPVSLAGGAAAFSTSALTVSGSPHQISASYSGDDNNNPSSTASALAQAVTGAPTTTALGSSPNPSTAGSTVTFTATVSSGAGAPAGNVVFLANATPFSTNALVGGVAAASTAALPSGTNTVAAQYAPQGDYLGSLDSLQQVVQEQVCSQTNAIIGTALNQDGSLTLTFIGTPQAQYYVVGSPTLSVPMSNWLALPGSTNTVTNSSGLWQLTVTNTASQSYYRSSAVTPCP
jgi:autotransporter-associated beta strand protein